MKQTYRGIVLKSFTPLRKTVIIHDREHGKFLGVVAQQKHLSNGSVLDYVLRKHSQYPFLEHVEIVSHPEHQARQDVLFLHHVLELCNYFIPIGYKEEPVFDFLHELCTTENLLLSGQTSKRCLLFKLCTLLGMYPEDTYFHTNFFHRLARLSIREMIKKTVGNNEIINRLDRWIHECIALHPLVDSFKTAHFLTGGRKS